MAEQYYHVVNGKVVPKPGNQRDPNKRYTLSNEKLIEFTPEEEAEADARKAQWEAEQPLRDKQKEEAEKFRESLRYKEKLVAFLDILGWSKAIKKSENDPELTKTLGGTLQMLVTQQKIAEWQLEHDFPNDFQVSHFSDCIVLSIDPDGSSSLFSAIDSIIRFFLMNGLLIRGGIVLGKIYHHGGAVYGPALIEAYKLEDEVAEVPRVILKDELVDSLGQNEKSCGENSWGEKKEWRIDNDGKVFFDYLQPFHRWTNLPLHIPSFKASLEPVFNLVTCTLKNETDEGIKSKHKWLAEYYNSILDEYPEVGLSKIEI